MTWRVSFVLTSALGSLTALLLRALGACVLRGVEWVEAGGRYRRRQPYAAAKPIARAAFDVTHWAYMLALGFRLRLMTRALIGQKGS